MNCNDNYEIKCNIMKYIGDTVVRAIQENYYFAVTYTDSHPKSIKGN